MCEAPNCEWYGCVRCAAGASGDPEPLVRSLGEPMDMSPDIAAMWNIIQMLYQGMKEEVFVQELPTAGMTTSMADMFQGLNTFETAISPACQVPDYDRDVWRRGLEQRQLWSCEYFALIVNNLQQSLLPTCFNSSWNFAAFQQLVKACMIL